MERYALKYMEGNRFAAGDTLSMLIERIEGEGGPEQFTFNVLKNMQVSGRVRKGEILYKTANWLRRLGIETVDDFQNYPDQELLEIVIRAIKGLGDAGVNYLFMLAGSDDRCKPDVHIHHCIRDALGYDISNEECQTLLRGATAELKKEYPNLTVAKLDGIIWSKYRYGSK